MDTVSDKSKKVHHGRNVKRFREILGWKQEAFAIALGEDWHQKRVSLLESKESIEPQLLKQISEVLKVPVEAIENFDEEAAVNIISNTFSSHDTSTLNAVNIQPTFNPIEKFIQALEENQRLNEENKKLYERLLQSEKEKVAYLEKLLNK